VAHSAKSWLCHHAVDRTATFLPWASEVLSEEEKISPIEASALILATLKGAWDRQFEALGPQGRFNAQEITITVPASFDAVAQKLTLEAEGPNFMADGKLTRFRDAYEFRTPDHIIVTSSLLGEDGRWTTFMTGDAKRMQGTAAGSAQRDRQ